MNKARSTHLLPLPTDIEETHEALSAAQMSTSSTELACSWLGAKKNYCNVFLQNNLDYLAPLMGFTLTGHSNQHRSFSTKYLQFVDSLCAICIFITDQLTPNILWGRIGHTVSEAAKLGVNFFIITNLIHKFLVHSHKLYKIKFLYMFRASCVAQDGHLQRVTIPEAA